MPRIRTIKPEFFLHEGLYALEVETGLPVRLAFAGLWTQCDREGRFEWRPLRLKTQILPYDHNVDFSRVLDALETRGFVVRYASEGVRANDLFGCVPTFKKHQVVNNRERPSALPDPKDCTIISDTSTRAPRVNDACPTPALTCTSGSGSGSGSGSEDNPLPHSQADDGLPPTRSKTNGFDVSAAFEEFWSGYPRRNGKRVGKPDAWEKYRAIVHDAETAAEVLKARDSYAANTGDGPGETSARDAHRWLAKGRWKEWLSPDVKNEEPFDELGWL